jgi:hypothetical protein
MDSESFVLLSIVLSYFIFVVAAVVVMILLLLSFLISPPWLTASTPSHIDRYFDDYVRIYGHQSLVDHEAQTLITREILEREQDAYETSHPGMPTSWEEGSVKGAMLFLLFFSYLLLLRIVFDFFFSCVNVSFSFLIGRRAEAA